MVEGNFEKKMYWYKVVEVNSKANTLNPSVSVGGIYGCESEEDSPTYIFDRKKKNFVWWTKTKFLLTSKAGASKQAIMEMLDKLA